MVKYFLKYKWHLLLIGVLIVLEPIINTWTVFWLEKIFNEAVVGAPILLVVRMFLIGFLLWILKRLVIFSTSVIKRSFMCNIKLDLKKDTFENMMKMNTADINDKGSSGEYMSVFVNDIVTLEERYFRNIIDFAACVVAIIINGAAFVHLNPKLAIPIMIFGVIVLFLPAVVSKRLSTTHLNYSNKQSKFTQKLKEFFTAYPTIKNYSIEDRITEKFDDVNGEVESAKFNADYELDVSNNIGSMMSWFMQIIGIGLGLIMVINGEILLGTVVAARSFASELAEPLQSVVGNLSSIRSVRKIVEKIKNLSTYKEEVQVQTQDASHVCVDSIEFCNVSLMRNGKQIINDFSYRFEPGKKYLIIGENGSGKSTLFKMLKKRVSDYSGAICIQGQNVHDLTNAEISQKVSYLNENVSLFTGTVRENIALFREQEEKVIQAAISEAQVELDIEREIIDGGNNISSGEQRRIELARSMLNKVEILVFDEVVSTLDIKTAYEIEKQVLAYPDKTVIFISHNFSGKLIREYDEILIMDSGRLADHGNYEQLMQSSAYFREICEIKFG